MRCPTPGTPKISAATTAIQAWPSAVRTPTRMPGVDAGRRILTRRAKPERKPKAWATSTRSRSTARTAPWVAKNTIQNTPTAMMNTAAEGCTPNQMMAKGTHASPGMGRSTRTTQAVALSKVRNIPLAMPSPTPAPTPTPRPTR
jgi:hypothetical protein